jgi:hypothetical protein
MAQRTMVLLEDDLDGGDADQTVTFSLDGVSYEIDLSESNAGRLRAVLGPYVGAGRRIGGSSLAVRAPADAREVAAPPRSRASGPARTDRDQLAAIRAWARRRGLEVNDRGRIPAHIMEQYNAGATR